MMNTQLTTVDMAPVPDIEGMFEKWRRLHPGPDDPVPEEDFVSYSIREKEFVIDPGKAIDLAIVDMAPDKAREILSWLDIALWRKDHDLGVIITQAIKALTLHSVTERIHLFKKYAHFSSLANCLQPITDEDPHTRPEVKSDIMIASMIFEWWNRQCHNDYLTCLLDNLPPPTEGIHDNNYHKHRALDYLRSLCSGEEATKASELQREETIVRNALLSHEDRLEHDPDPAARFQRALILQIFAPAGPPCWSSDHRANDIYHSIKMVACIFPDFKPMLEKLVGTSKERRSRIFRGFDTEVHPTLRNPYVHLLTQARVCLKGVDDPYTFHSEIGQLWTYQKQKGTLIEGKYVDLCALPDPQYARIMYPTLFSLLILHLIGHVPIEAFDYQGLITRQVCEAHRVHIHSQWQSGPFRILPIGAYPAYFPTDLVNGPH
jgi:hypothetical protein